MRILATIASLWIMGIGAWWLFFLGAYRLQSPEQPETPEEKVA